MRAPVLRNEKQTSGVASDSAKPRRNTGLSVVFDRSATDTPPGSMVAPPPRFQRDHQVGSTMPSSQNRRADGHPLPPMTNQRRRRSAAARDHLGNPRRSLHSGRFAPVPASAPIKRRDGGSSLRGAKQFLCHSRVALQIKLLRILRSLKCKADLTLSDQATSLCIALELRGLPPHRR